MEEENDEEGYTLTSFAPLAPEDEKSGLRKFIEGFTRKKSITPKTSHDCQILNGLENTTQNGTQSYLNSDVKSKQELTKQSQDLQVQGSYSKRKKSQNGPIKIQDMGSHGKIVSSRMSRTPSSVLRRLSQLVLLEKANPQQSQGSSNLKKYWMPDEQCKVCYECGLKFHTFRRRHHCRLCGQIFCSRCCNEVVSGQQIGYTGVFRVCIYCKKIVLTYTSGSDIEKNLKQLKEDLRVVAQPDSTNTAVSVHGWNASLDDPELNRSFDVLGVSAEEANLLKQDSFKDLWQQITTPRTGLEFLTHRVRLRTYSTCFVGRDLMNWLMINRKAPNRTVALQICQGLQDLAWIEPLNEREPSFKDDFVLYIPGPRASGEIYYPDLRSPSVGQSNDPNDYFSERFYGGRREPVSWLSASFDQSVAESRREGFHKSSSTSLIVNQECPVSPGRFRSMSCESIIVKVDPTSKQNAQCKDEAKTSTCPSTHSSGLDVFVNVEDSYLPRRLVSEEPCEETGVENGAETEEPKKDDKITAKDLRISLSKESEESVAYELLSAIHDKHISAFLVQLLDRVGLSQSWKDIIEPLAVKVCQSVLPDVANDDDMDVRHYVKIKKIPGGLWSDSRIVSGVVCTKNVVHKKMASTITQPLILMLACPVDFQRVENKMASLDSLVLQEQEFLKNMVGRIVALKPCLVLVEKTVSRLAQDMLLARGISVILNIKPKLMARISRCVQGDVLPSLDQGSRPRLGTCQKFKLEKFVFKNGSTKTLAFFEGCDPKLGSTIVLRGASRSELTKVRNVLRFIIFVAYNLRLEKAYIMDEFGTPFVQETLENSNGEAEEARQAGNFSRQNKVEFTVEGEKPLDEQKMEVAESKNERERYFTLSKPCVVSLERNCEVNTEKDLDKANESEHSPKDNTSTYHVDTSTENKASDSLTNCENVVNSESFQNILDNVVLCSSPLVKYPLPYVLTPEGKRCELRAFMTGDIYWSPLFFGESSPARSSDDDEVDNAHDKEHENVFIKEIHPFVFAVLENYAHDSKALTLLASYRAEGGRITLKDFSEYNANETHDTDGTKKDSSVQERMRWDKFVPRNREESAGSVQYREKLPFLRDCFDPFLHQMIAVMFSSYSKESGNFPRPCITPWTVFMEFYARNDITLGCFLERYCFRSSYVCPNPNCDVPMVKHVRYFAHGDGAVYIDMKNLESPIPGFSKTLLTWSWCKQCKQVTPVVPVSAEAWRLSFAKYLELRIYATCYRRRATEAPCDHSLHQDHYQYFAFNNIVASLKYVPVKIYKFHLPPSTITILEEERQPQFWIKHIQAMSVRVYQLINLINDRIAALKTEVYISDCVSDIAYDKGQLHEKIKVLESKAMLLLSPPSSPGDTEDNRLLEPHEVSSVEYEILDGITLLKRMMCEYGDKWNAKLVELLQLENEKKKSKSIEGKNSSSTQTSSHSPIESSQMTDDSVFSNGTAMPPLENSASRSQYNPFSLESTPSTPENTLSSPDNNRSPNPTNTRVGSQNVSVGEASQGNGFSDSNNTHEDDTASSCESEAKVELSIGQRGFSNSSNQKFQKHSKLWATLTQEVNSTLNKDVQYVEDRPGPKMKRIISQLLPGLSFRSIPSPFPVHEHHLLPVSDVIIPIVVNEREPTSIIAYTLCSPDYQNRLHKIQESMEGDSESFTCIEADTDGISSCSEGVRSRSRTRSEVETLSSKSLINTLDDFVDNYFQWSELDEDEIVVVPDPNDPQHSSEDSLGTPEVNGPDARDNKLDQNKDIKDGVRIPKITIEEPPYSRENGVSKIEDNMVVKYEVESGDSKENGVTQDDSVKSTDELNVDGKESTPNSSSSTQEDVEYHIKHSFSDSSAKFFCIVYFGEQFRRIRKAVFPDGEEKYIRSLQYCMKWQATGGKSGSTFCKTADDRFVIKEMSRPEAQSFLNIAPYYFQYIEKAIEEKRPTLLAKILGVYRIGCNSKLTNTPVRKDLLVMDNLLYNCKVDQVFDLKGSIRSRYVMSSEKENNVLMDQNLLEMIAESPLFIRPHSKAVLSRAINNDTEFLAKHMVMDYSLLLGIEQNSSRLIVGIIDFIRTFTWDKKLEMYVKSTGILGGQGKMPTVVSPELYRERFCEAMQRYFLMIPNKWMGLGNELK